MSWKPLSRFEDVRVPKLFHLRAAARAGLRVPETAWIDAEGGADTPPPDMRCPFILRSGSPTEDTQATSNAGQLLSLVVRDLAQYAPSLRRVIDALPADDAGRKRGVVFAQPLVDARRAGIAFFDGFYFERTLASGSNEALTSGHARGEVTRGHLARSDRWSDWLSAVGDVFLVKHGETPSPLRGLLQSRVIDLEFAEDDEGYVLLQARPALFPVKRNETLSLANHKEILGDPPSPWIASVLVEAGREVLDFFAAIDPEVGAWGEVYAVPLHERAWMSFSFFFRLMDHWGLPRAFVTQGVGGDSGGPSASADRGLIFGRFVRSALRLLRLQWRSLRAVLDVNRALANLDRTIASARTAPEIFRANVAAMGLAIRTNFAIGSVLSGVSRVRAAFGIDGHARVITEEMMAEYDAIGALPKAERPAALDAWLDRFGHRGPLESDPARPRFAELRATLLADLAGRGRAGREVVAAASAVGDDSPMFWIDRRREHFRDELMKRWQVLRKKALAIGEALVHDHRLTSPDEIFLLDSDAIAAAARDANSDLRPFVAAARARIGAAEKLDLPMTAPREGIDAAARAAAAAALAEQGKAAFPGIPLSAATVQGPAIVAKDLVSLLDEISRNGLDSSSILVVGALEPSWAVVFPRFAGVVAEIGGELSHASILLREARKPAIVNAATILRHVRTGDILRLDGRAGVVERVGRAAQGSEAAT